MKESCGGFVEVMLLRLIALSGYDLPLLILMDTTPVATSQRGTYPASPGMSVKKGAVLMKYDPLKTILLAQARDAHGLTQAQASEYFGFSPTKGRDSVAAWELGTSKPKAGRRTTFITYLWVQLRLKNRPADMQRIWREVMVGEWQWPPLEDHELPRERPGEIRSPVSDFVGRVRELDLITAYLKEMASSNRAAVCVIRGMGGVGKSELARKVAQQIATLFPDGQLFIELRGELHSHMAHEQAVAPVQALKRIVQMLTDDSDLPSDEEDLAVRYRSALRGRRVLVLADNARDSEQVRSFVPPVGCVLIVTSREHIEIDGMQMVPISPLNPRQEPDAAVQMLLTICPRIGTHAAELARLCAYLPLALRICGSLLYAARMRAPERFIEQLKAERLRHLVRLGDHLDNPQSSVAALIALSYDVLSPTQKQTMQQLSVFPASFALEAATAVLDTIEYVEPALEKLYLRSLVEWHEDTQRYALHDLVREFCQDHLTESQAVQLRHAQYYATIMQRADALYRNKRALEGLALFDLERAHIDAGWAWARDHAGEVEADELLITYDGSSFYIGDLRYDNRSERLWQAEAMRDAALRLERRQDLMQAYNNLAIPYFRIGDYQGAIVAFEAALALAREFGDPMREANFLSNLSYAFIKTGDLDTAIAYCEACIGIARTLTDDKARLHGEAIGMANLADAYLRRGDARRSLECAQLGYDACNAYGDRRGQCTALGNIASAFRDLEDRESAIAYFEQAIDLATELKDREELAESSWKLGKLLLKHDPVRARALLHPGEARLFGGTTPR